MSNHRIFQTQMEETMRRKTTRKPTMQTYPRSPKNNEKPARKMVRRMFIDESIRINPNHPWDQRNLRALMVRKIRRINSPVEEKGSWNPMILTRFIFRTIQTGGWKRPCDFWNWGFLKTATEAGWHLGMILGSGFFPKFFPASFSPEKPTFPKPPHRKGKRLRNENPPSNLRAKNFAVKLQGDISTVLSFTVK